MRNWVEKNPRLVMHFIPASSSWLNLVERFFGLITEKQIRRGVFSPVKDLEQKIKKFIEIHNAAPKPFVWTKTAEAILQEIGRARKALV